VSDWVRVARADEIVPGSYRVADVDGQMVAVFNLAGTYYAIEDTCTHDGGSLTGGDIVGEEIVCPRHGARFDIRTGDVTAPPATEPVYVFPVRLREGIVEVRDDRWD